MTGFFEQRSGTNFGQEGPLDPPSHSLSFLEASTLLLYRTGIDAYGNDIPLASGVAIKMSFRTYLGAALMELALRGYVYTDEAKPSSARLLPYLILALFLISFLSIGVMSVGSTSLGSPLFGSLLLGQLAIPIGLTGLVFSWLCGLILIYRYQERGQGLLVVTEEPTTGDEVLDELLWRMQPVGSARKVNAWLSFLAAQRAENTYDRIDRRLQEQGCIQLMGKVRFLFGKVETLVINHQNKQWRNLIKRLRRALLSDVPSDPYTMALLILLACIPDTFQAAIPIRLPGQPAGRKTLSGIYQILSEPGEIERARLRLRTLIGGDSATIDAFGPDLYHTLLHLRLGINESPKRR